MSAALGRAVNRWVHGSTVDDEEVTVTIIDGGIAASRRTGVSHHLADAAEVSRDGQAFIGARWLCGGSSVDAVLLEDTEVACMNCRLAAQMPQRPCVYYCWGEGDHLLYVGSSVNVVQRTRAHMTGTRWWPDVRRLTFDEYDTEFEIRRAEFEAIQARPGEHNKDGVRKPPVVPEFGFIIGGAES